MLDRPKKDGSSLSCVKVLFLSSSDSFPAMTSTAKNNYFSAQNSIQYVIIVESSLLQCQHQRLHEQQLLALRWIGIRNGCYRVKNKADLFRKQLGQRDERMCESW